MNGGIAWMDAGWCAMIVHEHTNSKILTVSDQISNYSASKDRKAYHQLNIYIYPIIEKATRKKRRSQLRSLHTMPIFPCTPDAKNVVHKTAKVTWWWSSMFVVVLAFPCLYLALYLLALGVRQSRYTPAPRHLFISLCCFTAHICPLHMHIHMHMKYALTM